MNHHQIKRWSSMVMVTYLFFVAVSMRRVHSQPGAKSDTVAQHGIYHPGEWGKTTVGKVRADDGTSHLRAAVENLRSSSSASFAAFAHTVCEQCKHAETACGCELGELNPALSTLRQYTESVIQILETAADIECTKQEAPAPLLNRVIVQVSGGMGNQIFSIVNALVLAVYTSRALVIVRSGRQMYAWDPVLEVSAILASRKCRTFTTLSLTDRRGYELIMHEDWSRADLEEVECIHVEEMMEDSYVWYGNARVASFLAENFHGLHFFFLSHFMWMGLSALDEQVKLQSLPRPEAWDGAQTLRDALSALRASGHPIIGVHMRLAGSLFLHHVFPSWLHHSSKVLGVVQDSKGGGTLQGQARYLEVEEGYAADCCAAYGEVLHGHLACVSAQIEAARLAEREQRGSKARGARGGEGEGQRVIVLWAADEDTIAGSFLSRLAGMAHVTVVRLLHEHASSAHQAQGNGSKKLHYKHDCALETALMDVALFTAASRVIGAPQSTFTYLLHARSLARPVLLTPSLGAQCRAHESSEAGFLMQGSFPTACVRGRQAYTSKSGHISKHGPLIVQDAPLMISDGRGFDFHCLARVRCVTTYALWKNTNGGCLFPIQENDSGGWEDWARHIVGLYDGAEFVINYLTRWGGSVEVAGEAVRLPVCPYATGPMIRGEIGAKAQRWRRRRAVVAHKYGEATEQQDEKSGKEHDNASHGMVSRGMVRTHHSHAFESNACSPLHTTSCSLPTPSSFLDTGSDEYTGSDKEAYVRSQGSKRGAWRKRHPIISQEHLGHSRGVRGDSDVGFDSERWLDADEVDDDADDLACLISVDE